MTKPWAFGLMFLCTFLTSFAQLFYKKGASELALSFSGIFLNIWLYLGVGLYLIGAMLMILALRGGDLSALYPVIATSYIWVSFISAYLLHESIGLLKWLGIAAIMIGISLIGIGSRGEAVAD
jgi:undecaprenyl phosphate-alpha-L-ara4N flippase subunit ArnE